MSNEAIQKQIESRGLKVGNRIKVLDGGSDAATTVSTTVYSDSSGNFAAGGLPFTVSLLAGVTSTSNSVASIQSSTTGTADVGMLTTVVKGLTGSLTVAGFLRITVTDDQANLASGAYYIPFGTLA